MNYKENHFRGHFPDKTVVDISHYNERGLNLSFFWRQILKSPTTTNEDMELARQAACEALVKLGGSVVLTVLDSQLIPENDRNACFVDEDVKQKTGDPGNQYYDWGEDNFNKRLYQTKKKIRGEIRQEKKQRRR